MKFMMHEEKRRDTHLTPENRCHKRHHNFLASNSFHPSQRRPMHILICAYTYNVFIYYIYIYTYNETQTNRPVSSAVSKADS